MTITTYAGRTAWQSLVTAPATALLCTDFDGVISPIVDDPDIAWASEEVMAALTRVAPHLGDIAIVTGRPARKAVQLGRLGEREGLGALQVLGLYGLERWDATSGEYLEPPSPPGVAAANAELPALLENLGLGQARVEDKRLSIGVHTRELANPAAAFDRLHQPLADLAARHNLQLEPGRFVLELRAPGSDKGSAMRQLITSTGPKVVLYAGDDLGDVPAFEAVNELRESGRIEALLVCAASTEQDALVELADVVVPGPSGFAKLLTQLADDIAHRG